MELHPPKGSKQQLRLSLTDSLGKSYITSYYCAWLEDGGLHTWFFPVGQGAALPKQVTLTLTHIRLIQDGSRLKQSQPATLTVPLTPCAQCTP